MEEENTNPIVEIISCTQETGWELVYDAARATQSNGRIYKAPSDKWKRAMMLAPHSPIRCLQFFIQMKIPYFVSVHLVRHHEGVQWFIGSQRNDRQNQYDRRAARQDSPVICSCLINADALRFISRRRLCKKASPETRAVWESVVEAVRKIDPIVADACHPECWWSKQCFEPIPCHKEGK